MTPTPAPSPPHQLVEWQYPAFTVHKVADFFRILDCIIGVFVVFGLLYLAWVARDAVRKEVRYFSCALLACFTGSAVGTEASVIGTVATYRIWFNTIGMLASLPFLYFMVHGTARMAENGP